MSDPSKVLLFGSFSEDETRSLLNQMPHDAPKPYERNELPATPPNLMPALTFGSLSNISSTQVGFPSGRDDIRPSAILKRNNKFIEKSSPENLLHLSENGKVHNPDNYFHENVVGGINFLSLQLSENNSNIDGNSTPELPEYEGVKLNGTINNSTVEAQNGETRLKPDVPNSDSQDISPRGLINSGNLCFLNATLQALLACSPFVQLLQGLRNCNIPKVVYPTLVAFAEFIGEFDVVGGSKARNKSVTELEAGKPFSPAMLEAVLRKFTPDIPSSMLGRPRQEDAQEFLSFIIDHMHDELLKLGGQARLDGGNSSLVSTSEDDEWETVGPNNKSAVTRTHNFVPSQLSSIFWWTTKKCCQGKR